MRYLERHYDIVSAPRVLDALQGRSRLPARPVLITFDDAYVWGRRWVAWTYILRTDEPSCACCGAGSSR
jgi:hypothetical protein